MFATSLKSFFEKLNKKKSLFYLAKNYFFKVSTDAIFIMLFLCGDRTNLLLQDSRTFLLEKKNSKKVLKCWKDTVDHSNDGKMVTNSSYIIVCYWNNVLSYSKVDGSLTLSIHDTYRIFLLLGILLRNCGISIVFPERAWFSSCRRTGQSF